MAMKIPQHYLENLSPTKYREYIKLLPNMQAESTKALITLIFTFLAMGILGIFAINPTFSTIVTLKRQISDSQALQEQLQRKISNLSSLQQQYTALSPDLPLVMNAIPQESQVSTFSAQMEALIQQSHLHVSTFTIEKIDLSGNKPSFPSGSSFVFSLEADGDYNDMMTFVSDITHMGRIVTLESFSVFRDEKRSALVLTLEGREYFKP
jgi:Tfp pilus assembly protein PilO